MGLLDAATVIRGNGQWSNGYDLEESGCGLAVRVNDICAPAFEVVVGDPASDPNVLQIKPFGIDAVLSRNVRCALDQDMDRTSSTLKKGEEQGIAHVFENGAFFDWPSPHLHHEDVDVLTASPTDSFLKIVGQALKAFYRKSTSQPLVHVGVSTMLSLLDDAGKSLLGTLGVETVFSPGYSTNLLAVTGPVTIRIGTTESVQVYDTTHNRTDILSTEVAAIEFDVCHAVYVDMSSWKGAN
jgi:hypothetical protein